MDNRKRPPTTKWDLFVLDLALGRGEGERG